MKKLLFILPLIFCFSLSFARVAMVCDYDDQGNRGDCTCYENDETVPCKCEGSPSPVSGRSCKLYSCIQYAGSGCYKDVSSACLSHGHDGTTTIVRSDHLDLGGNIVTRCYEWVDDGNDSKHVRSIAALTVSKLYFCNDEIPFTDCNSNPEPFGDDPPKADQKKVCANGECKCYNLTTGYEETCLGSPSSGGDDGSGSGDNGNSSGDNGSGSGNTGTGTGNGSGDSGNGQGAGSESSPSAGNGTNSGAGGDNSGTGTGSNNGDNSGGGTHTGSSGNQHGGGGTGLGGGSSGSNNGSPNGSEDGKEDGSDNGHSMGDGLNDYDFGTLPTDNDLPDPKDIDDKKKEIDLGGFSVRGYLNTTAQCPAPTTVDLKLFGTMEIEYTYFCNIARILRAVVVAFAWLSALLIIARINRS